MSGHHLEEVLGQNKVNVGTNGSEWYEGWMPADTLGAPLVPPCKEYLYVMFHIKGLRDLSPG